MPIPGEVNPIIGQMNYARENTRTSNEMLLPVMNQIIKPSIMILPNNECLCECQNRFFYQIHIRILLKITEYRVNFSKKRGASSDENPGFTFWVSIPLITFQLPFHGISRNQSGFLRSGPSS